MTDNLPDRAVVMLGDEEVGALLRRGEHARFEPSEEWARTPAGERPVLGQQFEDDPFAAHVAAKRLGAPLWFEHLLPELGSPLRSAVAAAIDFHPTRAFPLLLLYGDDLPGNVRVRTDEGGDVFRTTSRRVRGSAANTDDANLPLRVSLAGIQFKISARVGTRGIAVPGWDEEGDWIVKFADQGHAELPQLEYAAMEWARASGLDVPETRLESTAEIHGISHLSAVAGDQAFAIKRYDRTPTGRLHQEDFAQVLGLGIGTGKYVGVNIDSIVRVLKELSPEDLEEMFSRLVFCVLLGNDDAHAKNWSLYYPDPTTPRLSPAYDLVPTLFFSAYRGNPMALKMAGTGDFSAADRPRFRKLASVVGIDAGEVDSWIERAVRRQVDSWQEIRDDGEVVPASLATFIDERLERLPIVMEC